MTHWRENYPVAVYLISLAVSNYVKHSAAYLALDGETVMPVDYYIFPNQVWVLNNVSITPEAIKCYAERFGEYPYLSEKYCTASIRQVAAMEHQTCSSMGGYWEGTIVHELAHQWFGNQITCATWNDTWINEGGATYLEGIWYEHLYGREGLDAYMLRILKPSAYDLVSLTDQDFALTSTHYKKGAWIYHMLRYLLGDEDFFGGMKSILNDSQYSYGALTSQQYLTYLDSISGVNLDDFYDQWIVKGGHPVYQFSYRINNYEMKEEGSTLQIRVEQKQELSEQVPLFSMPVPVMVMFEDGSEEVIFLNDSLADQTFEFSFAKQLKKGMTLQNFDYGNRILCKKKLVPYLAANLPLAQSFEESDEFPQDWQTYNLDGDNNGWSIYADSSSLQLPNNYVAAKGNVTRPNDDWLVLPKVRLDSSMLNFYARADSTAAGMSFNVRLSTAGNQPEDFSHIVAIENDIPSEWTLFSHDLHEFSGSDVYLALQCTTENGLELQIDNIWIENGSGITGENSLPQSVQLEQNYPNPFNPITTINYSLPAANNVRLVVFNVKGEQIWESGSRREEAGKYSMLFDGSTFNSGIYFYTLEVGEEKVLTRKMALVK